MTAAPSVRYDAAHQQPVVWLSTDGEHWRAVPIPADRAFLPERLIAWGERIIVAPTHGGGPAVRILDNPAALLIGAGTRGQP